MASDSESLAALEILMNEFFAPQTSNDRKREIECLLHNFSSQQGAWKHCLYFMSNSSNHFVCMYSLTTIEKIITKQWLGLMWEDRAQLKATLYQLALEHHQTAPNFIRNKLVKLVVDIARLDWPHFYPDFFTNILQLIQNSETTVLGLVFLQTASEELVCPWEDLSVSRKEELRRLLLAHIPQVFSILTALLERVAQKQRHGVTATPPPSPTHGQPNSTSPVHSGSLLSSMFGSSRCSLENDSDSIASLTLQALAHLFSWVPLASYITPNLVTALFQLATITQSSPRDEGQCVGTLAMAAVNEIMYKNCVPSSCEEFLLNLFQQALHLLHNLLQAGNLDQIDETYLEKVTEFLRLFVGLHLRRLENNSRFPILEFLTLLFKYTFQQTNLDGYYNCLDVWTIFLEHLQTHKASIERYNDALVSLVGQILRKTQFKYNQAQLEELDDESLDDDKQTEWQNFLRQNIEVIAKVAELLPMDTYNQVYEPWKESVMVYMRLERALEENEDCRKLVVTAEHECLRLHCLLRDLSSLTQAVGRMYPHFIGEVLAARFSHSQKLMTQLTAMATYASRLQLHHIQVSAGVLTSDLVEVHAQVLAAMKAWCHWLAQMHSEAGLKHMYNQFIIDIVDATVPLLAKQGEPAKLYHSAAHLLASLTMTVRPARLWEVESVRDLYRKVASLSYLPSESQRLVKRALCCTLLLPCAGLADQGWDQRQKLLAALLESLTIDFRQLQHTSPVSPQAACPVITSTLTLLNDLVTGMQSESSNTRQLLYSAIQMNIYQTLSMFPTYVHSPSVCEVILDFFLTAFGGLQQQLGASFTETTVQTFLDVFTREHLSSSLGQEGGAGARVVDKFLQLLQLVMAEPGHQFKRFVPSTITLCLDHVYPLVAETPSPDIKPSLFALLHAILMHKWQYFYRSSLLQTMNQMGNETVEHREEFIKILQAYGQSLLQPDINIFGQNLRSLEQLNSKWKLYHKHLFGEELLSQFVTVLLHSLIHKSHALLEEEITVAIYHMAAVNFKAFQSDFLPQFLRSTEGLDDGQRSILQRNFKDDVDLPSFTQNVQRLVNDLRCYRLCNYSLPAGSIKL
ncbi:hypothetical protein R5R35_014051 [Gryllus longicercus]|uniref:Exportin-6 n=1 Tax=Gryllus longicercus TaxID=2509291 RepID=A0AAN9VXJ2_9ORTH